MSFPVLIGMATVFIVSACTSPQQEYAGKIEPITIGSAPLESSALIYIADEQGMFASNGVHVTFRDYDTGAAALNGLVNGEVDLAVPAEYALVGKAFSKDQIRAIASIDKAEYFELIARRDRGITTTQELKAKKIGVVRKTIAEFYLGRFLEQHAIPIGQVTLVDVNISESDAAIDNGSLDAIMSRPPYAALIQERLGAKAVTWKAQSNQALYAILIARNDWIVEYPERVRRLYRSLLQAEDYLLKHPDEARAIVQKKLKFDDDYMTAVWSQNQFSLSLEQSLIIAMEDEARWMIANNLTTEKAVPNFLDYIFEDALQAVRPEAVNIIR